MSKSWLSIPTPNGAWGSPFAKFLITRTWAQIISLSFHLSCFYEYEYLKTGKVSCFVFWTRCENARVHLIPVLYLILLLVQLCIPNIYLCIFVYWYILTKCLLLFFCRNNCKFRFWTNSQIELWYVFFVTN